METTFKAPEKSFPPPYKSNPGFSPFCLRCMEIDEAALLIQDPDAFAAAAAETEMRECDPATCFERPTKGFREQGGCPFYQGEYNCGSGVNVLCEAVSPQLHSYVGLKFCEGGRKVYCPIWRAKGMMQDVSKLDTSKQGG